MEFFSTLNPWALLVSGAAFWITGSLWFSLFFGKTWRTEVEKNGVKIQPPSKGKLGTMMLTNYAYNLLAAFMSAIFVHATNSDTLASALGYGLCAGIGFTFCTFGISYMWQGRSTKLLLLDVGHSVVGIMVCFVILTMWK